MDALSKPTASADNNSEGIGAASIDEVSVRFPSLERWRAWLKDNPWAQDRNLIETRGTNILAGGFVEPLTGRNAIPSEIQHQGSDWREGLACRGVNSRQRAVLACIEEATKERAPHEYRIFAPEAATYFALRMRGHFVKFLGAEYLPDPLAREWWFPVPHLDLCALDLPSNVFDIVTTNEVLEHVPDLDRALAEIFRVLQPGGVHIGTHPFLAMSQSSIRKAELRNGSVVFLSEPEYHGNPTDPRGSLVFEIPGWDILARAMTVGFSEANVRFYASQRHGVLSSGSTGVFVLELRK